MKKIFTCTLFATLSCANLFSVTPSSTTQDVSSFFDKMQESLPGFLENINRASKLMIDDTCQATAALKKLAIEHPIFTALTAASLMGKKRMQSCLKFAAEQPFLVSILAIATVGTQTSFGDRLIQKLQSIFPSSAQ